MRKILCHSFGKAVDLLLAVCKLAQEVVDMLFHLVYVNNTHPSPCLKKLSSLCKWESPIYLCDTLSITSIWNTLHSLFITHLKILVNMTTHDTKSHNCIHCTLRVYSIPALLWSWRTPPGSTRPSRLPAVNWGSLHQSFRYVKIYVIGLAVYFYQNVYIRV